MLRDTDAVRQVPIVLAGAGVHFLSRKPCPPTRIDGVCLWLNPGITSHRALVVIRPNRRILADIAP
jgi:hypothetical protein